MAKRMMMLLLALQVVQALDPWLLSNNPHSSRLTGGNKRNWNEPEDSKMQRASERGRRQGGLKEIGQKEVMEDDGLLESMVMNSYKNRPHDSPLFGQGRVWQTPDKRDSYRPNTCTCTCETKMAKEEDVHHKAPHGEAEAPPAPRYGDHHGLNTCYRQPCRTNVDCCHNYDVCDHSSKTCRDCWTKEVCQSDDDCCNKYPYCRKDNAGDGICVAK